MAWQSFSKRQARTQRAANAMKSRGAVALIVLILMLSLSGIALYSARHANSASTYSADVSERLVSAKQALIEYAVSYPQLYLENSAGPGKFPCPDSNGNGNAGPTCPTLSVGLLPREFTVPTGVVQTLQPDRSVSTEPLWWVVAGPFRNRPAASGAPGHAMILNSHTEPRLRLDSMTDVIGLLIAPGPPLPGQTRGGPSLHVADYLEGENADGDYTFSKAAGNDRVVAVRWRDVMPLVERQVLGVIRDRLQQYKTDHGQFARLARIDTQDGAGDLPCSVCQTSGWMALPRYRVGLESTPEQFCAGVAGGGHAQPVVQLPGWLIRNYWHMNVWVHVADPECASSPSLDGRWVDAVLVASGAPLDKAPSGVSQSRGAMEIAHYLDHLVNTDGDGDYEIMPGGNDTWLPLYPDD